MNVAEAFGHAAERDELSLTKFRQRAGRPALSSFHFHWARLIEALHGIEKIQQLLNEPDILNEFVRARARPNRLEGVGISEAPRGTLIHHYKIDEDGKMVWANLIIATGHNNLAMNRGVKQVAEAFIDGPDVKEGMLNRVEAVIRTFDPCLSCSTHALGQMPLAIDIVDAAGQVVREVKRD
jgi:NAD-reducing hydrogenase large subunit